MTAQHERTHRLLEFSPADSSAWQRLERDLIEKTPAILFVASVPEMKLRFISHFAETLLGISTRSWIEDPTFWEQHIDAEDRQSVLSERAETFREGEEYNVEYRMRSNNGDVLWVREIGRVVVTDGERFVVGVIVDLTKKRSAGEALGKGKRWLRQLIDSIPVQIWSSDPEGTVDFCNARWLNELGITLDDVNQGWQQMVHPDDRDRVRTAWNESVKKGIPYEQLERHRLARGEYRWFLCRAIPLCVDQGKIVRWMGANTDIDEQKKAEEALRSSEQRWRAVFDNAWVGVALMDPSLHYLEVNAAYERMMGYSIPDLRAMTCLHITVEEDREKYEKMAQELISGKGDHFTVENRYRRKDGGVLWARVEATAIGGGNHRRWVMIAEDITERKRLDDELRHERDRLRLVLTVGDRLVSTLNVKELFDAVLEGVLSMGWEWATILLPDAKSNSLVVAMSPSNAYLRDGDSLPVEACLQGRVYLSGKPEVFRLQDLPALCTVYRENPEFQEIAQREHVDAGCVLPLRHAGRIIGVLFLMTRRGYDFAVNDAKFLEELAGLIAPALHNSLQFENVNHSHARLLSGRRYIEEQVRREGGFDQIVGESSALNDVLRQVAPVAPTDSTVLILGESGTGKELIARAIHDRSPRRDQGFIKIDCSSIPPTLMESELFGHEKGAFTGAIAQRIGRFEAADQGTVLLDEIGEVPLELQPKLLRVLQDRAFERVGSTHLRHVGVRILAATNRDLESMVEAGKFREDLYYRLKVFPIFIPPLRERPADIPPLVRYYVAKYASRLKKEITTIPANAMEVFTRYPWPGNVRELQHFVERSVILTSGRLLQAPLAELQRTIEKRGQSGKHPTPARTLEEVEREAILNALQKSNWIVGGPHGAAAKLGVKRTTLASRMEKLGIQRPGT